MSQRPDIDVVCFNLIRSRSSARPLSIYYPDNGGFAACCHRSQHAMGTNYTHGAMMRLRASIFACCEAGKFCPSLDGALLDWPAALRPEGAGLSERPAMSWLVDRNVRDGPQTRRFEGSGDGLFGGRDGLPCLCS